MAQSDWLKNKMLLRPPDRRKRKLKACEDEVLNHSQPTTELLPPGGDGDAAMPAMHPELETED